MRIFRRNCNALREAICAAWASKKAGEKVNSSNFATLLITIKELNRKTQFRIKKARERTTEQKLGVDKLHLSLQNLLYEVAHLENEIKTCLEFKSEHDKLKLIPVQEFCEATGHNPSYVSTHDGTLERLYWELEQRKELSKSFERLQNTLDDTVSQIKRKQEYLSSFNLKLKELTDNTLAVQELMNLPFSKEEKQHTLGSMLPSPLYILYAHLKSYISMSGRSSHLSVEIEGDAELARAVNQTLSQSSPCQIAPQEQDDSEVEAETEVVKKRKLSRHKSKTQDSSERSLSSSQISSLHPLSVVLTLTHPTEQHVESIEPRLQLKLAFSWILSMRLVTVVMQLKSIDEHALLRSSSGSDMLCSELLLSNLSWGDEGVSADLPALLAASSQLWNACQPIGRPYSWAQQLCGFHCLMEVSADASTTPTFSIKGVEEPLPVDDELWNRGFSTKFGRIDAWLQAVEQRLRSRLALVNELTMIEAGRPALSVEQMSLLSPSRAADVQLIDWKRSTVARLHTVPRAQVPIALHLIQPTDAIFQCEFIRGTSCSAIVWVCLPVDYPLKPPLIVVDSISTRASTRKSEKFVDSGLSDLQLQELESEVNCFWQEFFTTSSATDVFERNILSCQLERCACCLDALWSMSGSADNRGVAVAVNQTRGIRYPTRSLPLRYLPSIGAFTHR
ncbi:unnamed protein product [Dicrocoelium dendriticum]|nr:unnamed protein product [Dicrocoelium dendriticum]